MSLKFQNGLEVDECTECWGSGGCFDEDNEFESCQCCGGTGYDNRDYEQYMIEQAELEEEENQKSDDHQRKAPQDLSPDPIL